ncbi:hypothetical protein [Lysobacter sp. Root690]|uniref:hypothetical protein n=1 Tax=Lysobacter sp. Root690 TaxID=1736588 RepID=UPI0006FDC357|nr:hypothetical protein [Lysobacter sp. Root690]KRB02299.1 hypothetical protein ASD86_22315 [Lysobacter sp. Root690]
MPADTTAPPAPRPPRPRRWRRKLLIVAALLLLALIALRWVSRPSQVSWIVLGQAGKALGLEITASGASEYRLRGTPMLEVRDLVAREPGAATPLLRAERVYLSLPWSTIRAAGAALDVERVELDAPQLDIAALQRWLATRPPSSEPLRLPSLSDGLRVTRGRVAGAGWSIDDIAIDVAELHPDRPLRGRLQGRVQSSGVQVPFDLAATLQRPAAARGLGLAGRVAVDAKDWNLPMRIRLGALLHAGDDGLGLDRMRLAAQARYLAGDTDLPFAFGLFAPLRYRDGEVSLAPLGAAVRGAGVIPNFDAAGRFAFGDTMQLHLDGRLAAWPEAWPALPPPLGQSQSPLPFVLDYRGAADFSGDTALRLSRDQTRFDGRFRLPQMLQWVDAGAQGALLPPLSGTLSTPKIEVSGASLEGVEIQIEQDDPPPAPSPTP